MVLDLIIPDQERGIVFPVLILQNQNQYFSFSNSLFLISLVFQINALGPISAQGGKFFGYSKGSVIYQNQHG
jgi:hypothetical protein